MSLISFRVIPIGKKIFNILKYFFINIFYGRSTKYCYLTIMYVFGQVGIHNNTVLAPYKPDSFLKIFINCLFLYPQPIAIPVISDNL